jgi:hypothetical protein
MSANLNRRLDALEQIAEQCRIREARAAIGDDLVRRSREHGLSVRPADLDTKIDRAMAPMETAAALLAVGLTMDEVVRHVAVQHDLDPERVLALYGEIRERRGVTP